MAPAYKTELCQSACVNEWRATLRSASNKEVLAPTRPSKTNTKFGDRAFRIAAWNSLPPELRQSSMSSSLEVSKNRLRTHFFIFPLMTMLNVLELKVEFLHDTAIEGVLLLVLL